MTLPDPSPSGACTPAPDPSPTGARTAPSDRAADRTRTPRHPQDSGALRSLLPVLGAHRATVLRTCLAALVDQAALVALVTLAAHTVGTAVIGHRPPSPTTVAVLIGLVVLRALATWREMDLSHDLAYRVLAELRVRVFDGLARSAPARIAGRRSGDLATTALGDVEALEFFYAHAIAQLLASGLVFAVAATLLGVLGPWLLLAVVPAALLLLWSPLLEARGRAERGARTRAALAELSAESVESVDGLRELLMAGALGRTRARLRSGGRRLARAQRAEQSWETGAGAVRDLLVVAAVIGVVAAAAHATGGGRLDGAWAPAAMALALGALAPVAESGAAQGRAGRPRAAPPRGRGGGGRAGRGARAGDGPGGPPRRPAGGGGGGCAAPPPGWGRRSPPRPGPPPPLPRCPSRRVRWDCGCAGSGSVTAPAPFWTASTSPYGRGRRWPWSAPRGPGRPVAPISWPATGTRGTGRWSCSRRAGPTPSTCGISPRTACAPPCAWWARRLRSSMAPSPRTSASVLPTPPIRSWPLSYVSAAWPRSSTPCPRDWTPRSANAARPSPAVSAPGWP
ncbi:ABC transporter transmembrane domain-containing protein [Streptomyces sp. NPDC059586]|uniref:ABC transporter transmembrane domain-containing protein n=1 Tax=Streptomyces sp. NPDC059586 TaxID=3346876 RepID=UPI0036B1B67A